MFYLHSIFHRAQKIIQLLLCVCEPLKTPQRVHKISSVARHIPSNVTRVIIHKETCYEEIRITFATVIKVGFDVEMAFNFKLLGEFFIHKTTTTTTTTTTKDGGDLPLEPTDSGYPVSIEVFSTQLQKNVTKIPTRLDS